MDTIYAVASGVAACGVCIIRVSGPSAYRIASDLSQGRPLPVRTPVVRRLVDSTGELIDVALVAYFAQGKSFTGQEVVEFNIHGSPAIMAKMLKEIGRFPDTRIAAPGEFTRLALQNGNLDLTQVEGIGQLLVAETEAQRKQAVKLLDGSVGKLVDTWRQKLIEAAATVEASIDFSDEDIQIDWETLFYTPLRIVLSEIEKELAGQLTRQKISTGFEIAIVGETNVGKSTLLNALAGRDVALTSSVAGTTRDVIEVRMNLGGYLATFLDTAGIRSTDDEIENMGIAAGMRRAESADLRIILTAGESDPLPMVPRDVDIVLMAKADLGSCTLNGISGLTGQGVDQLIDRITRHLSAQSDIYGVTVGARQADGLKSTAEFLRLVINRSVDEPELVASDMARILQSLDFLVGRVDVEDYLDHIFSSFCIGK